MGTVEGSRNHSNSSQKNSNLDSRDAATQQIESQFSPGTPFPDSFSPLFYLWLWFIIEYLACNEYFFKILIIVSINWKKDLGFDFIDGYFIFSMWSLGLWPRFMLVKKGLCFSRREISVWFLFILFFKKGLCFKFGSFLWRTIWLEACSLDCFRQCGIIMFNADLFMKGASSLMNGRALIKWLMA